MTIDDVAAEMRARFTTSQGGPVTITAEEWNTLAQVIYFCDALEGALPTMDGTGKTAGRARDLIAKVRSGRGAPQNP